MAGVKALRRIQLGAESTAGTAVAATTKWRGGGTIQDDIDLVFAQEDTGYIGGIDRTYIQKYGATLEMEDVEATYEQLPYIGMAGIVAETPGADGPGQGYIYEFPFPTTSQHTIKTYTIEGGDDQQEEEFAYGYVESFKLSGKAGEALRMSAVWKGRQVAPSTFTGSLALPTVEEILFGTGKLYIDAIGGTIGTTLKSNTLLGMDWAVKTGWMPVFTADNLYFSFIKCVMPELPLTLTFEHDGTSTAEKVNWRAQTPVKLRLQWIGSAVSGGGTFANKTLRIDLAGRWQRFEKLAEQNGNDIVTGVFLPRYNATASLYAQMTVVNTLATLP